MEDAQKQNKKQYDWLKGYQFVKGQSGNPGGRPKGSKSLKTFAKEYLAKLPDEEKVSFLDSLPAEIVWKMAEGNPAQDVTSKGESIQIPIYGGISIQGHNSNQENIQPEE